MWDQPWLSHTGPSGCLQRASGCRSSLPAWTLAHTLGPSHGVSLGLGAGIQSLAAALAPGSPGTDPGLLFPLLRSSEEVPCSVGARPLSGSSFPGGLGGTRMRRRKMHFFFLISLPQRNLEEGRGGESSGVCRVHPPGEQSQALKLLSSLPWTQS